MTDILVTEFGEYYDEIAKSVSEYQYPPADQVNFSNKDVVGVSIHNEYDMNFQIIFRDGDRTKVGYSEEIEYKEADWSDKQIPEGTTIAKVELYHMKDQGEI